MEMKRIDKENSKFIAYAWDEFPEGECCQDHNHPMESIIFERYVNDSGNKALTYTCGICNCKLHKELIEKEAVNGD